MSLDIIIIPTFNRPEMLQLCIENLAEVSDLSKFDVWICVDDHVDVRYDPYIYEVKLPVTPKIIQRPPHNFYGNSRNIMDTYREAYGTEARLVFMVEDDIIVSGDFFRWCYAVHGHDDVACAVATRPEHNLNPIRNWEGFYEHSDFASGAVCWKRRALQSVVRHAVPSFYNRVTDYCDEHYPNSPLCGLFGEQDGLIRRIAAKEKIKVAWPWYPRARHIGIYGYHTTIPKGDWKQRLEYLRTAIKDQGEMDKWRPDCQTVSR